MKRVEFRKIKIPSASVKGTVEAYKLTSHDFEVCDKLEAVLGIGYQPVGTVVTVLVDSVEIEPVAKRVVKY